MNAVLTSAAVDRILQGRTQPIEDPSTFGYERVENAKPEEDRKPRRKAVRQ